MRPLNQENEETNPEDPNMPGLGTENAADEANILSDQDETMLVNPADDDPNMGGDGSDDPGLDPAEFVRGEIDVKEQMDRAGRRLNHQPSN